MVSQKDSEPPSKRRKMEKPETVRKFKTASEISRSIRDVEEAGLTRVLIALRNQLTVYYHEDTPGPQDERILLAKSWMDSSPGAQEMFDLWSTINQHQIGLNALIVSILSGLLTLLTSHYTTHSYGLPILKSLLSPHISQRLNTYITTSNSELILVTLKLFNSMSNFASGRERKAVTGVFAWENKVVRLLTMRRRGKGDNIPDTLARPDIRTLYMLFILSFLEPLTPTAVKSAFLEQRREVVSSIFKGLSQDSYSVVRKVLETCWAGLWSDTRIKRTLKVGLFDETTLLHIHKIYERNISEGVDPNEIPADLVHHFFLAICTHPGSGVCFKDNGWYHRESDVSTDLDESRGSGKIYNKILSKVLKVLKVNEDVRQQELALKIMTACPELVPSYWSAASLTLEPRLSSRWLANISFFGSVISLTIPTDCFRIPGSDLYRPSPPSTATILEHVFPSVNLKTHFSKGLQSPSPLVQHCSALALSKCLGKYQSVCQFFQRISRSLEEGDDGLWRRSLTNIEREVRKRLPDYQVVVAFSQQKLTDVSALESGTVLPDSTLYNPQKIALLSESALRLLWLYSACLPSLVEEARFDVGKLLTSFLDVPKVAVGDDHNVRGLHTLRQLHVLRLLRESGQFIWSSKAGSSPASNFHILLTGYMSSTIPAICRAIAALIKYCLSETALFQHDPDEIHLWLDSLSVVPRATTSEAPDGTALTREDLAVVVFMDDCILRGSKTPFKYLEDLCALGRSTAADMEEECLKINPVAESPESYPSPLVMTVLEQLSAKLAGSRFSPSDMLAVVSYVRKLIFKLASKVQDRPFLIAISVKINGLLSSNPVVSQPSIDKAIQREVSVLKESLQNITQPTFNPPSERSTEMEAFLEQLESIQIDPTSARASAFELVEWVRFIDHPLHISEARRFIAAVRRFHSPALRTLFEYLHPKSGLIWDAASIVSELAQIQTALDFGLLFVQTNHDNLQDSQCRTCLVQTAFPRGGDALEVVRALCLIGHRIESSIDQPHLLQGLLSLTTELISTALKKLSASDAMRVKRYTFCQLRSFRILFKTGLENHTRKSLERFLYICLDPNVTEDKALVDEFVAYWSLSVRTNLESFNFDEVNMVALWTSFMDPQEIFQILDLLLNNTENIVDPSVDSPVLELLESALEALKACDGETGVSTGLQSRLPRLLAFGSLSATIQSTIASIVAFSNPIFHDGSPLGSEIPLAPILKEAEIRWNLRLEAVLEQLDIDEYLVQSPWTESSIKIMSALIYRSSSASGRFGDWLRTGAAEQQDLKNVIVPLHGFLDSHSMNQGPLTDDMFRSFFPKLTQFFFDGGGDEESRSVCGKCLSLMIQLSSASARDSLLQSLQRRVQSLPVGTLKVDLLSLGERLGSSGLEVTGPIIDQGLQWAVRTISDSTLDNPEARDIFKHLSDLISRVGQVKSHLSEPVMLPGIQSYLQDSLVIDLCNVLSKHAKSKPAIVNRYLQTVIQHPRFFTSCILSENSSSRDAIIRLLHTLFFLHPSNTCQPSHIEPLRQIYGGTLSVSDRMILSIFQLFETERKMSCASILCRWSSSGLSTSNDSLGALLSLESSQVFRTCLQFPKWRRLRVGENASETIEISGNLLYDPIFLLLDFAHMIVENPPTSVLTWVELFRTNVISVIIRALSCNDDYTREVALFQLTALSNRLETVDMQEKPHVVHILNLLKSTIPSTPSDATPIRLPAYTTLILCHALQGVFYPSNFIYPITARFLLQRPELDIHDVPMLFGMLFSNSDEDWRKERSWIIRFLADGMLCTADWKVLKRRHSWDLLASIFQSFENDRALRLGILEVLANITCNRYATTSLLLKSGLLAWIEMQLQTKVKTEEGIAWIRILENILTVVDPVKIESVTDGEWLKTITRCTIYLLGTSASTIFAASLPVIMRLGVLSADISGLIRTAFSEVKRLEQTITISRSDMLTQHADAVCGAPHRSNRLHEIRTREPLQLWREGVEALWQVTMNSEKKDSNWDALTCRMLVCRSIAGERSTDVCEWARREVVQNLRSWER